MLNSKIPHLKGHIEPPELARKVNIRRSEMDKSSYFWTQNCGMCHPGRGPSEYDRKGNRYDEYVKDPKNHIQAGGDNYLDGDYYKEDMLRLTKPVLQ